MSDDNVNIINGNGMTLLMTACILQNIEEVRRLLKIDGIQVNLQTTNPAGEKNTALIYACIYDNVEIVRLLLQHPYIDVNQGNEFNNTPLMFACNHNHLEIVTLLMSKTDIDVNIQDVDGISALMENVVAQVDHIANIDTCVSILRILLANKCTDVLITNQHNETALDLALQIQEGEPHHDRRQDIINLLKIHPKPTKKCDKKQAAGKAFKKRQRSNKRKKTRGKKRKGISTRKRKNK
jgi:ankyrin repeat protein